MESLEWSIFAQKYAHLMLHQILFVKLCVLKLSVVKKVRWFFRITKRHSKENKRSSKLERTVFISCKICLRSLDFLFQRLNTHQRRNDKITTLRQEFLSKDFSNYISKVNVKRKLGRQLTLRSCFHSVSIINIIYNLASLTFSLGKCSVKWYIHGIQIKSTKHKKM